MAPRIICTPCSPRLPRPRFWIAVELVKRADRAARAYDPRIFQVQASYADSLRQVLVATERWGSHIDRQPQARLGLAALARQNGGRAAARASRRRRCAWRWTFSSTRKLRAIRHRSRARGHSLLDAVDARGRNDGGAGARLPGILLHEAVGHGLEADFTARECRPSAGAWGRK